MGTELVYNEGTSKEYRENLKAPCHQSCYHSLSHNPLVSRLPKSMELAYRDLQQLEFQTGIQYN